MFSGKGVLVSSQTQKKKKINRIKNTFIFFFIIAGITSGLYSAPRYKEITISNVLISGNEVIEKNIIENKVWSNLSGNKYFFFPNKNIFLYPKEIIVQSIKDISPYVLSANVSFNDFNSINVEVVERKPYALYCGGDYKSEDDGECFFLDDKAFVFDEAPKFSGNTFVRYFSTTSEPYIGKVFSDTILFQTLSRFIDNLKEKGLIAISVHIVSPDEILFYLDTGSKLIISEKTDYNKVIRYIIDVMDSPDFKGKDEDGKLNVSYIDFRFGNKIFYRP
ncbi:MAG: hypothetical protein AAB513_01480 [Patescibacteria group bacterium]